MEPKKRNEKQKEVSPELNELEFVRVRSAKDKRMRKKENLLPLGSGKRLETVQNNQSMGEI